MTRWHSCRRTRLDYIAAVDVPFSFPHVIISDIPWQYLCDCSTSSGRPRRLTSEENSSDCERIRQFGGYLRTQSAWIFFRLSRESCHVDIRVPIGAPRIISPKYGVLFDRTTFLSIDVGRVSGRLDIVEEQRIYGFRVRWKNGRSAKSRITIPSLSNPDIVVIRRFVRFEWLEFDCPFRMDFSHSRKLLLVNEVLYVQASSKDNSNNRADTLKYWLPTISCGQRVHLEKGTFRSWRRVPEE